MWSSGRGLSRVGFETANARSWSWTLTVPPQDVDAPSGAFESVDEPRMKLARYPSLRNSPSTVCHISRKPSHHLHDRHDGCRLVTICVDAVACGRRHYWNTIWTTNLRHYISSEKCFVCPHRPLMKELLAWLDFLRPHCTKMNDKTLCSLVYASASNKRGH